MREYKRRIHPHPALSPQGRGKKEGNDRGEIFFKIFVAIGREVG